METHGIVINFFNGNGLAANDEQIALWRMNFFVEINLESENDVVRVERLSVGKSQATAKKKRVREAVVRNAPGFCEGRLGFLRFAVDVDQIGVHAVNDVLRRGIGGKSRIQRLRLGAQGDGERSAKAARRTAQRPCALPQLVPKRATGTERMQDVKRTQAAERCLKGRASRIAKVLAENRLFLQRDGLQAFL